MSPPPALPTAASSRETAIQQALLTALEHQRAGRLPQAEASYARILEQAPDNPDALHLLGLVAWESGNLQRAEELIRKAMVLNPDFAAGHCNLGIVLKDQGRLEEALASYCKSLVLMPDSAEARTNLGDVVQQRGRFEEAAAHYRQALVSSPGYAKAHNNLGLVLKRSGKADQAAASYRRAAVCKPDFAEAYNNLGLALQEQGEIEQATDHYRNALSCRPDYPEALNNLATALMASGELDGAVACCRRAATIKPLLADAHNNLGLALQSQGRIQEAVASYREALRLKPDYVEALNNFGLLRQEQGRLEEAVAGFRRAISLKPDFAEAFGNMGYAIRQRGDPGQAVVSCVRALRIKELPEFRRAFAECAKNIGFTREISGLREYVTRAVSEPWGAPGELASLCLSLVKLNPELRQCIDRAVKAWPARLSEQALFGDSGLRALDAAQLLLRLLESTSVCDLEAERFLTLARAVLLAAAMHGGAAASHGVGLEFFSALARQCYINEYVYACTEEEAERAGLLRERLVAALATKADIPALLLIAASAYFPLASLPAAASLLERAWPAGLTGLLVQQVAEPAEEGRYRHTIPALSAIDDEVSRLVQRQYEENPYPRWVKASPGGQAVPIDAYLRKLLPLAPFAPLGEHGALDVLVAGCGTGQHAIGAARQYLNARVLAVDLSLASLCYAKRKTRELGLGNIDYAQADIMKLGGIGRTFDIIEAAGVLHHLADPLAGWRVLVGLLRPRGFMRLGLYSETGRRSVVAARALIAQRGYSATAQDIRLCRQEVISAADSPLLAPLLAYRDFYGISECRDLIFHVQEHRFTLPQIGHALASLGLDLLGFCVSRELTRSYGERYPDDYAKANIDHWHELETDNPGAFASMYHFWVQKRG